MALAGTGPDLSTRDHVRPISRLGDTGQDNCVAACAACNSVRGRTHSRIFAAERAASLEAGEWAPCTWASRAVSRRFAALQAADLKRRQRERKLQKRLLNDGIDKDVLIGHDGSRFKIRLVRVLSAEPPGDRLAPEKAVCDMLLASGSGDGS